MEGEGGEEIKLWAGRGLLSGSICWVLSIQGGGEGGSMPWLNEGREGERGGEREGEESGRGRTFHMGLSMTRIMHCTRRDTGLAQFKV